MPLLFRSHVLSCVYIPCQLCDPRTLLPPPRLLQTTTIAHFSNGSPASRVCVNDNARPQVRAGGGEELHKVMRKMHCSRKLSSTKNAPPTSQTTHTQTQSHPSDVSISVRTGSCERFDSPVAQRPADIYLAVESAPGSTG